MLDGDQERREERELSEMGEQGRRGPESVLPCDLTDLIIHSSTCKAVFLPFQVSMMSKWSQIH